MLVFIIKIKILKIVKFGATELVPANCSFNVFLVFGEIKFSSPQNNNKLPTLKSGQVLQEKTVKHLSPEFNLPKKIQESEQKKVERVMG